MSGMAAKCNPRGCRVGVIFGWTSQWQTYCDRRSRREYERRMKKAARKNHAKQVETKKENDTK